MVSVIIPSRDDRYLQPTVEDVLAKAEGEVEVIVVLDGCWTSPVLRPDKRLTVIHHGTMFDNRGMRASINAGVAISRGEYIMKIDEHCMMDQGWDKKLIADCEDNWVVIPRRYRLDPDTWSIIEDGRPPIDYMYLSYPYERRRDHTCGLHGAEWKQPWHDNKDILIDDTPSMQGSCYFMKRSFWDEFIVRMEDENYGPFTCEAQEIGMKAWLSGGALKVNKKTWYAHMHKGTFRGKGYRFSKGQYAKRATDNEMGRVFTIDFWLGDKWDKRVRDFAWFIEKFPTMPGWMENWQEQLAIDKAKE